MTASMHRRARQIRQRAAIRSWEYRQRHHSKGVWDRLRRVLADAASVHVISEQEAALLTAEGFAAEPVGAELVPPKAIFFVPPARAEALRDAREVAVSLGPDVLAAPALALVRFP